MKIRYDDIWVDVRREITDQDIKEATSDVRREITEQDMVDMWGPFDEEDDR